MGLTMPLASSTAIVRASLGERLGLVYGVNTAGGVLGACATGFYGVGALGADATLRVAATISVLVGLAAMALSRLGHASVAAEAPVSAQTSVVGLAPPDQTGPVRPGVLTVVVAATGAASLALEVLWFRALVQQTAATTYAFTTMLAVVLTGIAVGSLAAGWLLRRPRNWLDWLAGLNHATAAGAIGLLALLGWAAPAAGTRGELSPVGALAMLPAMLCLGASLPIALALAAGSGGTAAGVARRIGRLYAANVAGAVAGALLGGFVLLPLLGVRDAIIAAGAVFACAAVLLRASAGRFAVSRDLPIIAGLIGVAVAGPDPLDVAFARRHGGGHAAGWRHDGVQATVMVHAAGQRRILYIDGLHQAADQPGMVKVHRTIGHLAMALHRDPRHALVIGLGGGATAGAIASHRPATLDIVELNEGVRLAAPLFAHISYDVLNRPRTVLHTDDARSFLLTTHARFDVVTADIIQPTHAGAGALYSREVLPACPGPAEAGGHRRPMGGPARGHRLQADRPHVPRRVPGDHGLGRRNAARRLECAADDLACRLRAAARRSRDPRGPGCRRPHQRRRLDRLVQRRPRHPAGLRRTRPAPHRRSADRRVLPHASARRAGGPARSAPRRRADHRRPRVNAQRRRVT